MTVKDESKGMTPEERALKQLMAENKERLKELSAINRTTTIVREGKSTAEILQQICMIMPEAWQYPDYTIARIKYDKQEFTTPGYRPTPWIQQQAFETIDGKKGMIQVCYTREFITLDEGPFLKEERHLINNLASIITGYLNSVAAMAIIAPSSYLVQSIHIESEEKGPRVASRKLLQKFLNKNNFDRDVYHDLMPYKVKEILLVANLYDAYSIEREGRFSEHVLGEYSQLNLTSVPRITGVSSTEEVFEQLAAKHFDMVILMMGADKKTPISLSARLKKAYPYIPVFLLLNNNRDIAMFEEDDKRLEYIDKIYIWNGESKVFFAMIKHLEDRINVENDTRVGLVRVILLVEDSPIYYSRYLPMLYQIVMEQTKRIIDDVSSDELYKVLRLRARPKLLHASTYEEAIDIAMRYRDYLLCLITDVKFKRDGVMDEDAGVSLLKEIKKMLPDLPAVMQSSDMENARKAYDYKASFINKNSESLTQDFKSFITHYLGFGNFIYRNTEGVQIAQARSLKEFENHLKTIPVDSLIYHARKDHFSLWLMARGEIQAAKILNPQKVTDFENPEQMREYLLEVISKFRNEQNRGKIIPYEESAILDESNIVSLTSGSLGGKGRGVAFINTLIYNYDFYQHLPNIHIRAPKTLVIGTDEFEYFMERNKLLDQILYEDDYEKIKELFVDAQLTDTLIRKLKTILKKITRPIAIRSSGLFEDSLMQPFAGIFETYLLPNNDPDPNIRLKQAMDAIKLVYASVFSDVAKGYIRAVNYKVEEEKMAVVLQEVVGNQYGEYFYPHISGVAQSYNYYPFAHMKPEEGYAVAALGLGKYVVEGEKAYRFSPRYANLDINSPRDQYKNSQVAFFAVDLHHKKLNLLEGDTAGLARLDLDDAEMHGSLKHLASVYDIENDRISPGLNQPGPRIVNFANILKYNYIPLAKTIEVVLDVVHEAMGTPVEIEFAVDLNKDAQMRASFYLLQIKPLLGSAQDYQVDMEEIPPEDIVLYSEKAMGNGLISSIKDVIYVPGELFDKSRTQEMAEEIDLLNKKMVEKGQKYVLVGPGRWGTRDRWIGIPVYWPQISNACVIVETSLKDFPLDASSGSHFFHNVVSMNVGYFSVQPEMSGSYINYLVLEEQEVVYQGTFFRHVRFQQPFSIRMDGKKRIAVVTR